MSCWQACYKPVANTSCWQVCCNTHMLRTLFHVAPTNCYRWTQTCSKFYKITTLLQRVNKSLIFQVTCRRMRQKPGTLPFPVIFGTFYFCFKRRFFACFVTHAKLVLRFSTLYAWCCIFKIMLKWRDFWWYAKEKTMSEVQYVLLILLHKHGVTFKASLIIVF